MDEILKKGTIKVYRAMELIDGKLYPPMCAKIEGKLVQDEKIGEWQKSKENPDLAIPKKNEKTKEVKYYFNLVKGSKDFKGNKIGDVLSRYNPYFHTSLTPLNDQFDTAYKRPNLVTVEVEIPVADLHSNYKAEKAKNKVGEIRWREGPVSSKLSKLGKPRIVFLSRYCKINRIVPDSEVAQQIKKQLEGTDIKISDNIITPNLANELKKINVPLEYTEIVKNYYSNKNENINTDNKEKIQQKKIYMPKPVTLEEILDVMDMKIDISDSGKIKIFDKQRNEYIDNGENFENNGTKNYEFDSVSEIFERLDNYICDYFINDMVEQLDEIGAGLASTEPLEIICGIYKNELEKGNLMLSEKKLDLAYGIVEPETVIIPKLTQKTETKFPEKEILGKIEKGKKIIDDYYLNRKEKNSMDDIWSINEAMIYVGYRLDIKGMKSSSSGTKKEFNIYSKKEREEGKKINERIRNELENYVEKYNKEEHWIYDNGWKIKTNKEHTVKKEHETKKINSNIASTLDNYKKQALELCSKDNPYFKLTIFIKDLVKDLSNEEKLNLFKQVNKTISQEINNLQRNCNHTENNETTTNTGKRR